MSVRDRYRAPDLDRFTGPNPLLEAWRSVSSGERRWGLPDEQLIGRMMLRSPACQRWAWAIPDRDAIYAIAVESSGCGVVEVGAGTGYWAAQLAAEGVDVVASDELGDGYAAYFPDAPAKPYHPVVRADCAEFAALHAHRTLLLVWPPYSSPMGARAVEAYWQAGGRRVLYVGEDPWGCTGDHDLHALLGAIRAHEWADEPSDAPAPRFRLRATVDIPQWDGIHDFLSIHDRIDYPAIGP